MSLAPSITTSPIGVATTRGALLPLIKALEKLTKYRRGRGTPILEFVCFDADRGLIWATDWETVVAYEAPLTGTGRTLIRMASLAAAIKPGGTAARSLSIGVSIRTDGARSGICQVGDRQVPLGIHPSPEEYPDTPKLEPVSFVAQLTTERLLTIWDSVVWATDKGNTLPILTAVEFVTDESAATFTATDRYRLARFRDTPHHCRPYEGLLPSTLGQYLPLLKSFPDIVTISTTSEDPLKLSGTMLMFRSGSVTITQRTLEGSYPKVGGIIPDHWDSILTFDRDAVIEAVRQVLPSVERNTPTFLKFSEGTLVVSTNTDAGEVCSSPVPVHHAKGLGQTWGVNPSYFLDSLRAYPAGQIDLMGNAPDKPIGFHSPNRAGLGVIQMPVRIAS